MTTIAQTDNFTQIDLEELDEKSDEESKEEPEEEMLENFNFQAEEVS